MHVTAYTAAALAVILVALSLPISLRRQKTKISLGIGEDSLLHTQVRAQGNFIEYAPIGLVLLALIELNGAPLWMLCTVATALVGGRVVHALGMFFSSIPLRGVGMIATYFSVLMAAWGLLMHAMNSPAAVT
jgi:uncharacterized membrane protein YecN with MAPEG domain